MGLPKYFLVDQHDATMCALDNAELDYRDLQLQLHRQFGIRKTERSVRKLVEIVKFRMI